MYSKKIQNILASAERILNFNESAEVKPTMESFGYTAQRMKEGADLLGLSRQATDRQAKEYGEQYQVSKDYDTLLERVDSRFDLIRGLARIVFRNRVDAITTLDLHAIKKKSIAGMHNQVQSFYDRLLANSEWVRMMGKYNVNEEMLQADLAEVHALKALKDSHSIEMGESQKATKERDEMVEQLAEWVADYTAVAEMAFATTPQLLKGLRIPTPPSLAKDDEVDTKEDKA